MIEQNIKYIISIVGLFLIIFTVDSLFFRHLFWERLISNIIIVVVFFVLFLKYINK